MIPPQLHQQPQNELGSATPGHHATGRQGHSRRHISSIWLNSLPTTQPVPPGSYAKVGVNQELSIYAQVPPDSTIASTQPKVLRQRKSYIKNYGAEWRWHLQARHLNLLALFFLTILSSSSRAIQKEKQYFCRARYDLTFSSTSESPSTEIKSVFSLLLLNFVDIKQWNCLKISGNWSSRKSVCS